MCRSQYVHEFKTTSLHLLIFSVAGALQKLSHPDGEVAMAKACAAAGVAMGISSFSSTGIEEIVAAGGRDVNFGLQLDILRNRELVYGVVKMAEGDPFRSSEDPVS